MEDDTLEAEIVMGPKEAEQTSQFGYAENLPPKSFVQGFRSIWLRMKNSKWYLPILAVIAFVVGYFSFTLVADIEREAMKVNYFSELVVLVLQIFLPPTLVGESVLTFVQMAIATQAFLGAATLLFFIVCRKYYMPFFFFAGFLSKYISLAYNNFLNNPYDSNTLRTFLVYLDPVIIYAFVLALLAVGLRYGKKIGLCVAILLNIIVLTWYNYVVLHTPDFRGFPFTMKSEPSSTTSVSQNDICITEKIGDVPQTDVVLHRCANPTSQFLTINGSPQKSYYAVDKVSTSPDGKSVAYFAFEKTGQSSYKNLLVMDGKEYELISPVPQVIDVGGVIQTDFTLNNIIFSPDSRHFAYTAYFRGGEDIYLDGKLFKSYRHQKVDEQSGRHCQFYDPVSDLQFSPGNKLLYILSKPVDSTYSDCDEAIMIDGVEYDAYPSIGPIAISSNGTKIVYAGYEKGKPIEGTEFSQGHFYLVIDKKRFKTFSFPDEKIYDLTFSDNGQAVCYTLGSPQASAKLRSAYIIVNNKEHDFPFYGQSGEGFSSFCNNYSAQF